MKEMVFEPTLTDIDLAVIILNSNKFLGSNGIYAEFLKYGGEKILSTLEERENASRLDRCLFSALV